MKSPRDIDVWRDRNPGVRRFSWSNKFSASRIDNILTSQGIDRLVGHVTYLQGIFTDHSAQYISVSMNSNKRGSGYWKLNCAILQKNETINKIRENISSLLKADASLSSTDKWINFKSNIAKVLQNISRSNASDEKLIISQLSEKVQEYEEMFPLTELQMTNYLRTKAELEGLLMKRAESLIFRSKIRWAECGEKNTKYFFNLEKSRYNAKTCQKLISEAGTELKDDCDILNEQFSFYRQLYDEEHGIEFSLKNSKQLYISEKTNELCSAPLSTSELNTAVQSMKNGKTPGEDGLPIEFYKIFWNDIKEVFQQMIDDVFKNNFCPSATNSGILNLIPKKGKDARFLKNLRPITLLNVDYKIIEKTLANRLDVATQRAYTSRSNGLHGRSNHFQQHPQGF